VAKGSIHSRAIFKVNACSEADAEKRVYKQSCAVKIENTHSQK
jgi:hypothetical protein